MRVFLVLSSLLRLAACFPAATDDPEPTSVVILTSSLGSPTDVPAVTLAPEHISVLDEPVVTITREPVVTITSTTTRTADGTITTTADPVTTTRIIDLPPTTTTRTLTLNPTPTRHAPCHGPGGIECPWRCPGGMPVCMLFCMANHFKYKMDVADCHRMCRDHECTGEEYPPENWNCPYGSLRECRWAWCVGGPWTQPDCRDNYCPMVCSPTCHSKSIYCEDNPHPGLPPPSLPLPVEVSNAWSVLIGDWE